MTMTEARQLAGLTQKDVAQALGVNPSTVDDLLSGELAPEQKKFPTMFAENLNRICREQGTNLTTLVRSLGWSTSRVSAWNRGSLPKEKQMVIMAKKLNCSIADFFKDDTTQLATTTPQTTELPKIQVETWPTHTEVYIDGKRLDNVKNVRFTHEAGKPPVLTVDFDIVS